MINELEWTVGGVIVESVPVRVLMYVDDIVLSADYSDALQGTMSIIDGLLELY